MNRNMSAWGGRPPMGPVGINYGVIALPDMSSGNLYLDDEDHNNKIGHNVGWEIDIKLI